MELILFLWPYSGKKRRLGPSVSGWSQVKKNIFRPSLSLFIHNVQRHCSAYKTTFGIGIMSMLKLN